MAHSLFCVQEAVSKITEAAPASVEGTSKYLWPDSF
jgi:hypothetical protein